MTNNLWIEKAMELGLPEDFYPREVGHGTGDGGVVYVAPISAFTSEQFESFAALNEERAYSYNVYFYGEGRFVEVSNMSWTKLSSPVAVLVWLKKEQVGDVLTTSFGCPIECERRKGFIRFRYNVGFKCRRDNRNEWSAYCKSIAEFSYVNNLSVGYCITEFELKLQINTAIEDKIKEFVQSAAARRSVDAFKKEVEKKSFTGELGKRITEFIKESIAKPKSAAKQTMLQALAPFFLNPTVKAEIKDKAVFDI